MARERVLLEMMYNFKQLALLEDDTYIDVQCECPTLEGLPEDAIKFGNTWYIAEEDRIYLLDEKNLLDKEIIGFIKPELFEQGLIMLCKGIKEFYNQIETKREASIPQNLARGITYMHYHGLTIENVNYFIRVPLNDWGVPFIDIMFNGQLMDYFELSLYNEGEFTELFDYLVAKEVNYNIL